MGEWMVTVGDCREVMAAMDAESVDAIVCDPPYGLEFMGKGWDAPWKGKASREFNDIEAGSLGGFTKLPNHSRVNNVKCSECDKWKFSSNPCECANPNFPNARAQSMLAYQQWFETVAVEALRVLKPGGHLLAFGGTRTFHRMTVAIEDAGFEVRDCLSWLYGSGFPKSLNVSKAIDKRMGAEPTVVGSRKLFGTARIIGGQGGATSGRSEEMYATHETRDELELTTATSDEARRWEGWGTALKPAWEPIVMARKRLVGTVAGNVLAHGTGGLNIDGSRIAGVLDGDPNRFAKTDGGSFAAFSDSPVVRSSGRWPANVLLDEGAAAALDEQTGVSGTGKRVVGKVTGTTFGSAAPMPDDLTGVLSYGDKGGASRFFYVSKASRRDRNEGLDGMPEKRDADRVADDGVGGDNPRNRTNQPKANHHPTVKPTALMRHLVRLVTPPGGLVLDPFTGSGSTGKAAVLEGFRFHGIEQDAEYADIARARIAWAEQQVDAEQPTLM